MRQLQKKNLFAADRQDVNYIKLSVKRAKQKNQPQKVVESHSLLGHVAEFAKKQVSKEFKKYLDANMPHHNQVSVADVDSIVTQKNSI